MAEAVLIYNFEEGKCNFCCIALKVGEGILIEECLHLFCRPCLETAIETRQDAAQIVCLISDEENCKGVLRDSEVKALVSDEVYKEYSDRSLRLAQDDIGVGNTFNCKTEGCVGWCEFEPGAETFKCPLCNQTNCIECEIIHAPFSCDEYWYYWETGKFALVQQLMKSEKTKGFAELMKNVKIAGAAKTDSTIMAAVLNEIERMGYLKTFESIECKICLSTIDAGDGVILQECLHTFCKDCLVGLVAANNDVDVKCPFADGLDSCNYHLTEREIKALCPSEIYEKHLKRSVTLGEANIENSFHCKTPDCPGWCEYEKGAKVGPFFCENCHKTNCIRCDAQHDGTCKQYQARLRRKDERLTRKAVDELLEKGTFMRCPKCNTVVEKLEGCDLLQCFLCKTYICWATKGPRWGPRGKGDTSGGCRCGVQGRKCHPACHYCH